MKGPPARAVIFDCDGVLIDSEPLALRGLQEALREIGVNEPMASLSRFCGRSHVETVNLLETESGKRLSVHELVNRIEECYRDLASSEGVHPCNGVQSLLTSLSERNIPFTLASSGSRAKVQFSLRASGLESAFPRFVCADDVCRAKPAPDLYLSAAALLGLPPQECLAIEDAPSGVQAAGNAGMRVIGVTTSFPAEALSAAEAVVGSLSDLLLWSRFSPFFAVEPTIANPRSE